MDMTLREKFAADPRFVNGNPKALAAALLALYERGGQAVSASDPVFLARCDALCRMSDEAFHKEHQRVLFEYGRTR